MMAHAILAIFAAKAPIPGMVISRLALSSRSASAYALSAMPVVRRNSVPSSQCLAGVCAGHEKLRTRGIRPAAIAKHCRSFGSITRTKFSDYVVQVDFDGVLGKA
jgi:hypothetical protein